ncbi:lasso RiPP family leader peptide-containing protein [Actinoplanes sp. NPDC051470]
MTEQNDVYEPPALTDLGDFEELTLGTWFGLNWDLSQWFFAPF